jgi:2-polyprenyl-3-methyl-5-hydroxy-6-metoxy-1,4-benzoquinol methylase
MLSPAARRRLPELMDAPDLDAGRHRNALRALQRGSLVSRTAATLWPAIRNVADRTPDRAIRILDLACGGGHLAVSLARRCGLQGVRAEVCGLDISAVALDYARAAAAAAGVSEVRFERLDVVGDPLPEGFDVVVCSLFLHHLADQEAEEVLRRMKRAARCLVMVSDLRRTDLGYLLAWVGCRLLSRSRVFHVDGPRSVEAAFSTGEARQLAERAGLTGAIVSEQWPQRWVICWRRADG